MDQLKIRDAQKLQFETVLVMQGEDPWAHMNAGYMNTSLNEA